MARATVRTYRHGLGDCHLVSLHRPGDRPFQILIDCGVILGTSDAKATMTAVMESVLATTDNHVDLLVATHDHWDHLSGFVQAADAFSELSVDQVWMAWTENPDDLDAKKLLADRQQALAMLRDASLRVQSAGSGELPLFHSLVEFFGTAARTTTRDALEAVRTKANGKLRYCDPSDPPTEIDGADARIYVLGPPRDVTLIKRLRSRKSDKDQTYELALARFAAGAGTALNPTDTQASAPFSAIDGLSFEAARDTPFFQENYFAGPDWRRIDSDWLMGADELAIALDNLTNNTSLVLAIDLDQCGVLLFAADAQVGNWLSWQDCSWDVAGNTVTGPDLVARTILYKVGHHGSPNATMKTDGVKRMERLQAAIIPVNHEMAVKKGWNNLPFAAIEQALDEGTSGRGWVLRTDQMIPDAVDKTRVRSTDLYIEVDV